MQACEQRKDDAGCERACAKGLAAGCYLAAEALEAKEHRDKRPAALRLYEQSCTGGEPRGCGRLGLAYRDWGGAGPSDVRRALASFERGCAGDDPLACYELGSMHYSAWGAKQDIGRAATLFEKSGIF